MLYIFVTIRCLLEAFPYCFDLKPRKIDACVAVYGHFISICDILTAYTKSDKLRNIRIVKLKRLATDTHCNSCKKGTFEIALKRCAKCSTTPYCSRKC